MTFPDHPEPSFFAGMESGDWKSHDSVAHVNAFQVYGGYITGRRSRSGEVTQMPAVFLALDVVVPSTVEGEQPLRYTQNLSLTPGMVLTIAEHATDAAYRLALHASADEKALLREQREAERIAEAFVGAMVEVLTADGHPDLAERARQVLADWKAGNS